MNGMKLKKRLGDFEGRIRPLIKVVRGAQAQKTVPGRGLIGRSQPIHLLSTPKIWFRINLYSL
jgi:hypothetical protein